MKQGFPFLHWTLTKCWDALVGVTTDHEETARQGRLFNTLMIISLGIVICLTLSFLQDTYLDMVDLSTAFLESAFPLAFIPISLLCIIFTKRGYLKAMIYLYTSINIIGISSACLIFDGIHSPAWVLFFWSISISGMLLKPRIALYLSVTVITWYAVLYFLESHGIFSPLISTTPEAYIFQCFSFLIVMLLSTSGILTYLTMSSLRQAMAVLHARSEELNRLSLRDELSGLYNRRGFFALAEQHLKTAARTGTPLKVIYCDIDDMKRINDTWGHQAGDRTILNVVGVLRQTFRQSDIIARVGGDEFVVLLSEAGPGIESIIRRRIDRLVQACSVMDENHFQPSLSMGFTDIDPRQNCCLEDLINEADRSMYKQKRQRKAALAGNKTTDSVTIST